MLVLIIKNSGEPNSKIQVIFNKNLSNMSEDLFDKDKIVEKAGLLPYAHHVGSAVIKPDKESVIKSKALAAMEEQTEMQIAQIKKQIDLLAEQAREIIQRKELSYKIYQASMGFTPLIGHTYYLYQRNDESYVLSMVSPEEWGARIPFQAFEGKVRLLADHTWTIEK